MPRCNAEGCETPHCRRCGQHYEPCPETERAGGVCDDCLIGQGPLQETEESLLNTWELSA
jgi:hypothetical protein